MPPRPPLPPDDLYARLEVPVGASHEAIEIAWRALLKRHHPDVAGTGTLDAAKRINVAHDWLSDPDLRARYDHERHPERDRRYDTGHPAFAWAATAPRPAPTTATRRPVGPDEAIRRFVERVGRLTPDEFDRLSVAEPRSIAFVASIGRFLSPEQAAAVGTVEERVRLAVPVHRWADPPTQDAILAAAHELVLAGFLDEHLTEPFRGRARERLTRAWDAAIDQPRYGPNSPAVERLLARLARTTPDEARRLVQASGKGRIPPDPWPRVLDPDDDEALRVSSALAARDAAVSIAPGLDGLERAPAVRARRLASRTAHAVALRHAFTATEFRELVAAWSAATGDPATGRAASGVRVDPSVRRRA